MLTYSSGDSIRKETFEQQQSQGIDFVDSYDAINRQFHDGIKGRVTIEDISELFLIMYSVKQGCL